MRESLRYAVVAAAVVLSACSAPSTSGQSNPLDNGGSEPGDAAATATDLPSLAFESGFPVGTEKLRGVEGREVTDVDALHSSAKNGGLAPAQVAALADGEVDFAEYEQLFTDFVDCAADRGIVLDQQGLIDDPIRGLEFFGYGIPEINGEPPDSEVSECLTRHLFAAEEIYMRQHERPRDEQAAAMKSNYQTLYKCYVDAGAEFDFPIDDVMEHEHELLSLLDTYPHCPQPRW